MSFPEYKKGTIDCTVDVDTSHVKGRAWSSLDVRRLESRTSAPYAIGAKGIGKEAVRAFAKAGSVTVILSSSLPCRAVSDGYNT